MRYSKFLKHRLKPLTRYSNFVVWGSVARGHGPVKRTKLRMRLADPKWKLTFFGTYTDIKYCELPRFDFVGEPLRSVRHQLWIRLNCDDTESTPQVIGRVIPIIH